MPKIDRTAFEAVTEAVETLSDEQAAYTLAQVILDRAGHDFDLLEDIGNFIADGGE